MIVSKKKVSLFQIFQDHNVAATILVLFGCHSHREHLWLRGFPQHLKVIYENQNVKSTIWSDYDSLRKKMAQTLKSI